MSRKIIVSILLGLMMCFMATIAYAQDGPRPTPTDIGAAPSTPESTVLPTAVPTAEATSEPGAKPSNNDQLGNVRGFIYVDVNGDGLCVDTGVMGEEPAVGIPVEFVSSDEQYVFTHASGANGDYELAGAGQSNWRVTAKPDAEWVVTSQNPQYGLVSVDNLSTVDVNFCVAKAGTAVYPLTAQLTTSEIAAEYVMPEAGAPAVSPTTTLLPILLGLGLILVGLAFRCYEISRE